MTTQRIEARSDETEGLGPQGESLDRAADAPENSSQDNPMTTPSPTASDSMGNSHNRKVADPDIAFVRAALDFSDAGPDRFKPGYDQHRDVCTSAVRLADRLEALEPPKASTLDADELPLVWLPQRGDAVDPTSLPDGQIYGWMTKSGTVYAGEGYPVPLRKFNLDTRSCVALLVKPAIRLASPNASRGDTGERDRQFVTGSLLGDLKACSTRDSMYAKAAARIEQLEGDCRAYDRTMQALSQPNASNGVSGGWNKAIEAAAKVADAVAAECDGDVNFANEQGSDPNMPAGGAMEARRVAKRIRALAKPTDQNAGG